MSVRLELGNRYVQRDGKVVGPLVENTNHWKEYGFTFLDSNGYNTWRVNGTVELSETESPADIVKEYEHEEPQAEDRFEEFQEGDIVDWMGLRATVVSVGNPAKDTYPVSVEGSDDDGLKISARFTKDGRHIAGQLNPSITLVERPKPPEPEVPKAEKNKLKVGDKVFVSRTRVQWEMDHMEEMHSIGANEQTFRPESNREIAAWAMAAQGRRLSGEIIGYGSADDGNTGRLNVRAKVSNDYGTIDSYFSEDDLKKLEDK